MIFSAILWLITKALEVILGILPLVPATPTSVVNGGNWIITQIQNSIGFLNYIYGSTLLTAIILVILITFNFEWIYHSTLWLLRKLPFLGIS